MKRFVTYIVLFLLPVAIILGVLEYGMRTVPNDYTYKNHWLEQHITSLHIWSFGPSHGAYGISPKHFSKSAFNSAHVSQTLKFDAFIFDKFIDRADSLEWVILPVSYFSLGSDMESDPEWWRVKNYCIYYDCPYFPTQPKYHCEVIGNPLSLFGQIKRVCNYWMDGTNDRCCDSLGLDLDFSKDSRKQDWYMNGANRVVSHTKDLSDAKLIRANIGYLESIINKCQEKQIHVLLLTTPVCYTYSEAVDSTQYALMTGTCEKLAAQYPNVVYLNLFKDNRFDVDDFWDADHLHPEGAAKLTLLLDDFIENYSVEP